MSWQPLWDQFILSQLQIWIFVCLYSICVLWLQQVVIWPTEKGWMHAWLTYTYNFAGALKITNLNTRLQVVIFCSKSHLLDWEWTCNSIFCLFSSRLATGIGSPVGPSSEEHQPAQFTWAAYLQSLAFSLLSNVR